MNNTINKENILLYYITQNHSRQECLQFFNITKWRFQQLLKTYHIQKDKKLIIAKRISTNLQKYGGKAPSASKEVVNKIKNTKKERYGDEGCNNIEQIQNTNLQKYGVKNISEIISPEQREQMKEKAKNTCIKNYGTAEYWNTEKYKSFSEERKEKSKKTCLEKYNSETYTQSDLFKEKIQERTFKTQQTNLQRYGVKNVSQCLDYSRKRGIIYIYDNKGFDSSWELALWIYCKDHNEELVRCPCKYKFYYQNKEHYYIPDYKYSNKIIELKGPHFFEGEKMICPFNRSLDGLYEAKHQCMIQNKVEIWKKDDIQFALEYVNNHYGYNFIKSCKKKVCDK